MFFLWKGNIWKTLSFSTGIYFHCLLLFQGCTRFCTTDVHSILQSHTYILHIAIYTYIHICIYTVYAYIHPGCEACVITAQDIFFPIFAAGSLVPQWEITFLPVWQGSLLPLLQLPRTWKRQLQWKTLWSVTKPFLVLHSGMSIICVVSK